MSEKPSFPVWMEELTPADIAAVNQGGCDSGAYMPAVTYSTAVETMAIHGDQVLEYIYDHLGEVPQPSTAFDTSTWSARCCFYLSYAVELFCSMHEHLADWDADDWS